MFIMLFSPLYWEGRGSVRSGCRSLQVGLLSGWWPGWARGGSPVRVWGGGLAITFLLQHHYLLQKPFNKFDVCKVLFTKLSEEKVGARINLWYHTASSSVCKLADIFCKEWRECRMMKGWCSVLYMCTTVPTTNSSILLLSAQHFRWYLLVVTVFILATLPLT